MIISFHHGPDWAAEHSGICSLKVSAHREPIRWAAIGLILKPIEGREVVHTHSQCESESWTSDQSESCLLVNGVTLQTFWGTAEYQFHWVQFDLVGRRLFIGTERPGNFLTHICVVLPGSRCVRTSSATCAMLHWPGRYWPRTTVNSVQNIIDLSQISGVWLSEDWMTDSRPQVLMWLNGNCVFAWCRGPEAAAAQPGEGAGGGAGSSPVLQPVLRPGLRPPLQRLPGGHQLPLLAGLDHAGQPLPGRQEQPQGAHGLQRPGKSSTRGRRVAAARAACRWLVRVD